MNDNVVHLTAEQATACLKDGEEIHVFLNNGILIGADWERKDVIEKINSADDLQVGGEMCVSMGHGLVVFPKGAKYQSDLLFVECDTEKLLELAEAIGAMK